MEVLLMGGRSGFVSHLPAIFGERAVACADTGVRGVEGRNISSNDRHAWRLWKMLSCSFLKIKRKGTRKELLILLES
jgi:hypothetical protein